MAEQRAESNILEMIPLSDQLPGPVILTRGDSGDVGRSSSCQVVLGPDSVSRHHAEVKWTEGGWCVVDLKSQNGTSINGWKIEPNTPIFLHDGDLLMFGGTGFRVNVPEERLEAPEATDSGSEPYRTRKSIFIRLKDNDPTVRELGWEEFHERYAPMILGYCRNAGLPARDAEDVLQDVMLGFFRVAGRFVYDPEKGRFRGYLKRAVHNAIRERARQSDAARSVTDTWLERHAADADQEWDTRWAEQLLARATEEARRRVDALTFEAFVLYGQQGVPVEVVAERVGLRAESVYQAKARLLRMIRAILDELRNQEG